MGQIHSQLIPEISAIYIGRGCLSQNHFGGERRSDARSMWNILAFPRLANFQFTRCAVEGDGRVDCVVLGRRAPERAGITGDALGRIAGRNVVKLEVKPITAPSGIPQL